MRAFDTDPESARVQRAVLSRLGGPRRLQLAWSMSEAVRGIAADGIRARHPAYSEEEVQHALRRMLLGDALFRAAWPTAPLLDP